MASYKTFITIEDPNQVVLSDLPFQQGQRVRVVILSENNERSAASQKFRKLFRDTQTIPEVSEITEKDIVEEIEAHRRGE
jgi:endonuclease III